ncbi:MAG: NAD(P)-dependent glycerol-3-phosphate dehydrogenase [Lewinellaceae bacterium]|nr:NAD(P)-dependent glycerol-3-phosphate dehydrogenase [Saprospiraceae bacterium]MCB9338747.1 NAD(P)-dependent glycerol-3-phosphate dehydrogenase [Lewinellaceae bacterium]
MSKHNHPSKIGVIGAGSFGTAVSNLLAYNNEVLLFSRQPEQVEAINKDHRHPNLEVDISPRVRATGNLEEVADQCNLIFPIVSSEGFRSMMQNLSPYLHPYHLLIHGTKGFDLKNLSEEDLKAGKITRNSVRTMSEVIREESVAMRIGCLSGPNLANEIMAGQPTATVIGSRFEEVIDQGKKVLSSRYFQVFGTYDILGAELAGALKNIIAIGSGVLGGLGMGKNIQALLITRGLMEMIYFGRAFGTTPKPFVGTAGIGDLVCTATSMSSRNYTFGYRMGQGETMEEILSSMPEVAEGVRTLKIAKHLADYWKLHVPITQMLYRAVFESFEMKQAIEYLMRYPYYVDVDFI